MNTDTVRNATLDDLVTVLRNQHARRLDMVVPAPYLSANEGNLVVGGLDPQISEDGVDEVNGVYRPTEIADEGLAAKLDIPPGYLRRCRTNNVDLYDENINGWLLHPSQAEKLYLLRCLRHGGDSDGTDGIARAFLTNSYRPIDHLDLLMATLDGIRQAGADVRIDGCDLTDRRMHVRVVSESVKVMAPLLLKDYNNPFRGGSEAERRQGWTLESARQAAAREGQAETDEPIVNAGFIIRNSETGHGQVSITPRLYLRVCRNGLVIGADALKAQHLGQRLDAGVIRWSADTAEKQLQLITAQAKDAVNTFLDVDYIKAKIAQIEQQAAVPIGDPARTIEIVSKKLRYSDERQADILRHFTLGGQMTAGGVAQALTSVAQIIMDGDEAARLEDDALEAMALAAVAH